MEQFSRLFSIPLQILCWFLACKSITSVLKSNAYKDRHISYILKDGQIPSFTSRRILYLQEYIQPVGDSVLPCNTFRMLFFLYTTDISGTKNDVPRIFLEHESISAGKFTFYDAVNMIHDVNRTANPFPYYVVQNSCLSEWNNKTPQIGHWKINRIHT